MEGYDLYFRSGDYERRYPAPNRATLRLVEGLIDEGATRVLDFGCGSGRYAVRWRGSGRSACWPTIPVRWGWPCCASVPLPPAWPIGSRLVSGSLDDLRRAAEGEGPVDIALMLFGVLGHVRHRSERLRHLRAVRELLAAGSRLVVGVPNAARRFRREQAAAWSGGAAGSPATSTTNAPWELRIGCSTISTARASWRGSWPMRAFGRSRPAARACCPNG